VVLLIGREDRVAEPPVVTAATAPPVSGSAIAPYEVPAAPGPLPVPAAPLITMLALGVILASLAVAALGDLADFWELTFVAGFSIAIVVVGVALVAAAFVGRAVALIPLGVFLVAGLLGSTVLDPIVKDGVGDREHTITSIEDLEPEYRLGAGELLIDLRDLELNGERRAVNIELGMGELIVKAPRGVRVVVDGGMGAGELEVFGLTDSGLGVEIHETRDGSGGILELRVDVGAGHGQVD